MDIHNTRFSSLICTILHFYLLIGKIKKWTKNQGFRFETVLLSIFKQIMYHMIHALKTRLCTMSVNQTGIFCARIDLICLECFF